MKTVVICLWLLFLFSFYYGDNASEKEKVKKVVEDIIAADNHSDITTVLSMYAENAILMPPGKAPIIGKAAIDSNYRQIFSRSTLQLLTTIEDVILNGEHAVAIGTNSGSVLLKKDSSTRIINDKYIMLLEKSAENSWKIKRLIWNTNN